VRNVGDAAFVPDQVVGLVIAEMLVEDAVEPTGLVLVSIDAVFNLLGSVLFPLASVSILVVLTAWNISPCGNGWPGLA
jgi:hypothetical protein